VTFAGVDYAWDRPPGAAVKIQEHLAAQDRVLEKHQERLTGLMLRQWPEKRTP
jgi:hypothetical protein